jgi:hypothetical protein
VETHSRETLSAADAASAWLIRDAMKALSIQTTENTKRFSSDCSSINPSRNEMKYIIITLAANMKKLCLLALSVMASVTAHAETKIGVAMSLFDDMWLTTTL